MPRRSKEPRYVETEEVQMPDVGSVMTAIRAGSVAPRDAQKRMVEVILSKQQSKLVAERYVYHLLDEANNSVPTADEDMATLMAWSVASAAAELLTRRVEKILPPGPKPAS